MKCTELMLLEVVRLAEGKVHRQLVHGVAYVLRTSKLLWLIDLLFQQHCVCERTLTWWSLDE